MVDITNLETQVQNRINNLTGTETLEQLLELKRASEFISVDTAALDTAIESRISSFDGSTKRLDLLIGNRLAVNPYTQGGGGEFGFTPAPTTNFSTPAGGLFGQQISGLDLQVKTEAFSGTGKFLIYHLTIIGSGTGGDLYVSLNIDGVDICSDLKTNNNSATHAIYSSSNSGAFTTSNGVMPPLLVKESFRLSLQKSGATNASINAVVIPIE